MKLDLKIRTDFVTNSSSSSFIFNKNTNLKELEKKFNEKALYYINLSKTSSGNSEDYKYTGDVLKGLIRQVVTPDKLSLWQLLEVLSWYLYDYIAKLLKEKKIEELSKEEKKAVFAYIISDLYDEDTLDEDTLKRLEEKALYELNTTRRFNDGAVDVANENYEEWAEFVKYYKDKPYKLLEDILDCKYIIYNNDSIDYYVAEFLSEMDTCSNSCNHMG